MKKLLVLLMAVTCASSGVQGSREAGRIAVSSASPGYALQICECGAWLKNQPGIVYDAGGNELGTVTCNGSLILPFTGTYTIQVPGYACNPVGCKTSFQWSIKGPVSGNGTGSIFDFDFSEPGYYDVRVTPICGGNPCQVCEFAILISSECKCGEWFVNESAVFYDATGQSAGSVKCGGSLDLAGPGIYLMEPPGYICDPTKCENQYEWNVSGPLSGSGAGDTFEFDFSSAGTYMVDIYPICGTHTCRYCRFAVVVPVVCLCGKWNDDTNGTIQDAAGGVVAGWYCNNSVTLTPSLSYTITAPAYQCQPPECETTYTWEVKGPEVGSGYYRTFSFNFSLPGTYTITYTAYCGQDTCETCTLEIVIKPECRCGEWIKDMPGKITDEAGGITNWFCGDQKSLPLTGTYTIQAPGFFCQPDECEPDYKWVVNGPAGGTGTGNSFTFDFSATGSYTVSFTAWCGDHECTSCRMSVDIKDECQCGKWIEDIPGKVYDANQKEVGSWFCGDAMKAGLPGWYTVQAPGFFCQPEICDPSFTWQVDGPVSGSGTGDTFSYDFTYSGNYTVTFVAYCGKNECESCKLEINIRPECQCGAWIKDIPGKVWDVSEILINYWFCGESMEAGIPGWYSVQAPGYFCQPDICDPSFTWEITGPVSGSGSGDFFTFEFSAAGSYTVTFTAICGDEKCKTCTLEINIRPECQCGAWIKDIPGKVWDASEILIDYWFCGESMEAGIPGWYSVQAPGYFCQPDECDPSFTWEITGPVSGSGSISGRNASAERGSRIFRVRYGMPRSTWQVHGSVVTTFPWSTPVSISSRHPDFSASRMNATPPSHGRSAVRWPAMVMDTTSNFSTRLPVYTR